MARAKSTKVVDEREAITALTSYLGSLIPAADPRDIDKQPALAEAVQVHEEAVALTRQLEQEGDSYEAVLAGVKRYVENRPLPMQEAALAMAS